PNKGEFFFKDPHIIDLDVDQIPPKYLPQVKIAAQKVASILFAIHPIYTLKNDTLKHRLARSMLRSVVVKNEKLLLSMSVL
ncbi:MAG: DUF1439 domain-containing protein, partial [Gammaproteobacteria bacterium]|nr:DUF1439 domain-containing protein [Gammaproteobacteria bacterium]